MSTKDVVYPVAPKTMHDYAESIFAPIRRGENVTTVWVPMAGRRLLNKFILENIDLFDKELPNNKQYVIAYVEPLDLTEESLIGYLRLIAQSFIEAAQKHPEITKEFELNDLAKLENENSSYAQLLSTLSSLLISVAKSHHEIILFLGEFDELQFANKIFYHNLKSLWSRLYPSLHYVFIMRERVTREQNIETWGELNEVILQNTIYVPLVNREGDIEYLLNRFSKEYCIEVKEKERKVLIKLCGGHPYLLKVCFRIMSRQDNWRNNMENLEKVIKNYYELKSVARGILNVRSENEKEVLRKIANTQPINGNNEEDIVTFLVKLGIVVDNNNGTLSLFGDLFSDVVRNTDKKNDSEKDNSHNGNLYLDEQSGAIMFNRNTVEEKFTHQEYLVLNMFLDNIGKLKSRDDIGDSLWGKEAYEKYSDWAIDQLMSKLRKKLFELKTKEKLLTVRGKGYKLVR